MFQIFRQLNKQLHGKNFSKIPGAKIIQQFLYRVLKPRRLVTVMVEGNKMLVDPRDEGLAYYLLLYGNSDGYMRELMKKHIKEGMTVIDIGAQVGYFTLLFSKLVGREGRVYAFEPDPNNYKILKQNVRINNLSNVILVPAALSNKKGKAKLFLDKRNLGNMSLVKLNIPADALGGEVEIGTVTLDDYLGDQEIDFIKLDVQGAEGLVIQGAKKTLLKNNLKFIMEFWPYGLRNMGTGPVALLQQIDDWGYKFKIIDEQHKILKSVEPAGLMGIAKNREKGKGWANLFCERPLFKKVLGVITARGSSKNIPGKNIKSLCGKPLIAYTIEAAQKSGVFDRLILSTDSPKIAEVAKKYGCEVPFLRPAKLAQDATPHLPVMQHAVKWLEDNENYKPDYVMILQPTSPLRQPFHIKDAVTLILKSRADSVLAVAEAPESFNPARSLLELNQKGFLRLCNGQPLYRRPGRRQDAPKVYFNTTSIYLFKTGLIFDKKSPNFFGEKVLPYVIESKYAIDINTVDDWQKAEEALKKIKK